MRLRGVWFLALIGIVAALGVVRWVDRAGRALGVREGGDGSALRSLAFRVPESGRLEFDLPSSARLLRVFGHAELEPDVTDEEAEASRCFALRFRFEGWNDATADRTYHFRSRRSHGSGAGTGSSVRTRYLRSPARPLDVRRGLLSLADLAFRPVRVVVSAESLDPGLAGVAVRVYYEEGVGQGRRAALWPRLSIADRIRRAAGNIYPHYLLTPSERDALIGRRWVPVAPSGVPGTDYERRIVLHSEAILPVLESSTPGAIDLPPGIVAVVRSRPGEILEVEAAVGAAAGAAAVTDDDSPLDARFLREEADGSVRAARPVGVEAAPGHLEISIPGEAGWLTVEAPVAFTVRAGGEGAPRSPLAVETIQSFDCSRPASPPQPSSGVGTVSGTGDRPGVGYRIVHLPGEPTPVRIDLRSVDGVDAIAARFRLATGDGRTIAEGEIEHDAELSRFDWTEVEGRARRLSEPTRRYLLVPVAAERLEVTCGPGGGVSLYNQEPDRRLTFRLPERPNETRSRNWSPVLPLGGARLVAEGRSMRLRLQRRPPEIESGAGMIDDSRTLETFTFAEGAIGRSLLVPSAAVGGEAASWRYQSVAEGRVAEFVFGKAGSASVEPTILFRRERTTPFRLVVEIDGRTLLDEEWAGRQGELRLPPIRSGRRSLKVRGDGEARFFVNEATGGREGYLARRFVSELPARPFEIVVDKRGSTVVTGRLYFGSGPTDVCVIEAGVSDRSRPTATPLVDWTYTRRRYVIEPTPGARVAQLGSDVLWVGAGEPFYLRLGEDLPDGPHRVRIAPQCSGSIYLTLSQLALGSAVERRLVFQTDQSEPL